MNRNHPFFCLSLFLHDKNKEMIIQKYKDKRVEEGWKIIEENPENKKLRINLVINYNHTYLLQFDHLKTAKGVKYFDIYDYVRYLNRYIEQIIYNIRKKTLESMVLIQKR